MEFLYLDESGKQLYSYWGSKGLYVFGGIVVNRDKVFESLSNFKPIYQNHRWAVREAVRAAYTGDDRNNIGNIMKKFEFHAAAIFKKAIDRENPWYYYPAQDKFRMIYELIDGVIDSIDHIYIFEAKQDEIDSYRAAKGLVAPTLKSKKKELDAAIDIDMVKLIIDTYYKHLLASERKGSIIPDRLDADIREHFVGHMNTYPSEQCWSEPIVVDSSLNAFTQLVDVITYVYIKYKTLDPLATDEFDSNFYRAMKRVYKTKLKDKAQIINLVDSYKDKDSPEYHQETKRLIAKGQYLNSYRYMKFRNAR